MLAYNQPAAALRTPRASEYDIIARITSQLALAHLKRAENRPGLLEAVYRNERLWSALAADVADPGNQLPAPLLSLIHI